MIRGRNLKERSAERDVKSKLHRSRPGSSSDDEWNVTYALVSPRFPRQSIRNEPRQPTAVNNPTPAPGSTPGIVRERL
jgi:hypothetical protein